MSNQQLPQIEDSTLCKIVNCQQQLRISNQLLIFEQNEKTKQKRGVSTKVSSVDNGNQQHILFQLPIQPTSNNKGKNKFSVESFEQNCFKKQKFTIEKIQSNENKIENFQCVYQHIFIEDCLVNIYALKRLLDLTSTNLTQLTIKGCIFYVSDDLVWKEYATIRGKTCNFVDDQQKKEAIQENKQDEDLIINLNNYRMLREINISFRIKSLQLPLIESINIHLLKSAINKKKQLQQMQQYLHQSRDQRGGSSMQGQQQQKQQEKSIAIIDSLVEEYECDRDSLFVDFELNIKPKLEEKYEHYQSQSELVSYLVNGESLRNSSVQEQINEDMIRVMKEHHTKFIRYIKYSIYNNNILIIKEQSLEDPLVLSMMNTMIIKNKHIIKTVLFKETGTIKHEYLLHLLDALVSIVGLESIAFFDAQPEFQSYYLLKDIVIRESNNFGIITKKILFITLNRSLFDITEYKHQVLGQERVKKDEDYEKVPILTIPKHYSFYIIDSNDIYEFTPYQFCMKELLFPNRIITSNQQSEELLQYDIWKLIKEQEKYPQMIRQEIQKYQDKLILTNSGISEQITGSKSDQDCLFLQEQSLLLCNDITGYLMDNQFISKGYQINKRSKSEYYEQKNESNVCFSIQFNQVEDFIFKNGKDTKVIKIGFDYKTLIIKKIDLIGKQLISRELYQDDNNVMEIYKDYYFFDILTKVVLLCLENDIQLQISYFSGELMSKIISIHTSLIAETKQGITLKRLSIIQNELKLFYFSSISSGLKVQELHLCNMKIDSQSFIGEIYLSVESLTFEDCQIEMFDHVCFKNLKKVVLGTLKVDVAELILYNILLKEQQINPIPPLELSSKECLQVSISLKFNNEIDKIGKYEQQTHLSKDIISRIVRHQGRLRFSIDGLLGETQLLFKKEVYSRYPVNINLDLLGKFYGKKFINSSNSTDNDNINEKIKEDIQINRLVQNNTNIIKENQDNLSTFKELKKLYSTNDSIDLHVKKDEEKQKDFLKNIPECCKEFFNSIELPSQSINNQNNQNLINLLKIHTCDFCLFKTSILQQKFQLRKIQIKFLGNLLVKEPIIQNYQEMELVEELDFCFSQICDILQIKFIDFMIQYSSQLKVLKFNQISLSEDMKSKHIPIHFTIINSQNLKQLEFSEISFRDMHPLLEALLKSMIYLNLDVLKFDFIFEEKDNPEFESQIINYGALVNPFIEKQSPSIQVLHTNLFTQDTCKAILQCANLQELVVSCNLGKILFINDLMKIQTLRQISINTYDNEISKINLESFLESSKNEWSHLKQINLRNPQYLIQTYYMGIISGQCARQINDQFQILQIFDELKVTQTKKIKYVQEQIIQLFNQFSSEYKSLNNLKYYIEGIQKNNREQIFQNLQQFHWHNQFGIINSEFLNSLFISCKESLSILSFCGLNKENCQFQGVDFSILPKTIEYLSFSGNRKLISLQFLDPLYRNIKYYLKMVLDISQTGISYSEVHKYMNHIKVIFDKELMMIIPVIQCLCKNSMKEVQMIDFFRVALNSGLDESEIKLFYQLFLTQKIDIKNNFQHIHPFILSPLQVISSQVDFRNNSLMQIYKAQKQDDFFSLNNELGNKYLLLFTLLLQQNHKYSLGYSQNYHGASFYIQKRIKNNEIYLSKYLFSDYLLLQQMISISKIEKVYLPLSLEISYSNQNNSNESIMIEQLSKIPPSEIILENLSIQFIKVWYVINFISPLTTKTTLRNSYMDRFSNYSIGYYLTKDLSENNILKKVFAYTPKKYRYDETVQHLSRYFDQQIKQKKQIFLLTFFPLYVFVCIFGVIYLSIQYNITCSSGLSWNSYICYLIYGILTIVIEFILFKKCLSFIAHLIPTLEIDLNTGRIISMKNAVKKFIIDSKYINQQFILYSFSFLQSQLALFDKFTNLAFLHSTYICGNYTLFVASLIFILIPFLYTIIEYLHIQFYPSKKCKLPTDSLDTYYNLCNVIEFKAVADILDIVSPSNFISIGGRMYSSKIVRNCIKIIIEAMPLVIIQIYNLSQSAMTSSLVLSLLLSIITFLTMLRNLLTTTPSTLNQEDFNQLNEKKRKDQVVEKYEQRLQTYEYETFAMKLYGHLKDIRKQYLKGKKQNSLCQEVVNNYNKNIEYYEKLFDSPKSLLIKYEK